MDDVPLLSLILELVKVSHADLDLSRLTVQWVNLKARAESVSFHPLRYAPLPWRLAAGLLIMVLAANKNYALIQHSVTVAWGIAPADARSMRVKNAQFTQSKLGNSAQALEEPNGLFWIKPVGDERFARGVVQK